MKPQTVVEIIEVFAERNDLTLHREVEVSEYGNMHYVRVGCQSSAKCSVNSIAMWLEGSSLKIQLAAQRPGLHVETQGFMHTKADKTIDVTGKWNEEIVYLLEDLSKEMV